MIIVESNVTNRSERQMTKMDISFASKREEKMESRTRRASLGGRFRQRRPQLVGNQNDMPQIIVDRVSIQLNQQTEYQSNYFANLSSHSIVTDNGKNETTEYDQNYAMEKIVGGVIDQELVIKKIEQGETIQFNEANEVSDNLTETQRRFLPNQIPNQIPSQGLNQLAQSWQMSIQQTDIQFETEKVDFSSKGEVKTEDGRTIQFSLDMSLDRAFVSQTQQETLIKRWKDQINLIDPLVISLDGRAPALSDARFEFDLDSDGETESINFVSQGSGFLAFDKNNDQVINNGSELFGPGTGNGFGELSQFDTDGNSWIDENDEVFSKLSVWTKNEAGEDKLTSLLDAGIGAINLDYEATQFNMVESDNTLNGQLKSTGMFLFENGSAGSLHQIDLVSHEKKQSLMLTPIANEFLPESQTVLGGEVNLGLIGDLTLINRVEKPERQETFNPIQDLLDRIEELKQEMTLFHEKMSTISSQNRGRHNRRNRYMEFNPDPSQLLFGGERNERGGLGRYL